VLHIDQSLVAAGVLAFDGDRMTLRGASDDRPVLLMKEYAQYTRALDSGSASKRVRCPFLHFTVFCLT